MQAKLIVSFASLPETDFLARAQTILASLGGNSRFPQPWPAQVPGLAQLGTDLNAYQAAYGAAQSGDKSKLVARQAARETLIADLKKLARYLELVADGDVEMLLSTGYELHRDRAPAAGTSMDTLPAPDGFKLERGSLSGTLVVKARRIAGAGSYEAQTTLTDPTQEANWTNAGTFMRCSKIELSGFTPGKMVSVRLRGIGSRKPGVWTPAASLMVV